MRIRNILIGKQVSPFRATEPSITIESVDFTVHPPELGLRSSYPRTTFIPSRQTPIQTNQTTNPFVSSMSQPHFSPTPTLSSLLTCTMGP